MWVSCSFLCRQGRTRLAEDLSQAPWNWLFEKCWGIVMRVRGRKEQVLSCLLFKPDYIVLLWSEAAHRWIMGKKTLLKSCPLMGRESSTSGGDGWLLRLFKWEWFHGNSHTGLISQRDPSEKLLAVPGYCPVSHVWNITHVRQPSVTFEDVVLFSLFQRKGKSCPQNKGMWGQDDKFIFKVSSFCIHFSCRHRCPMSLVKYLSFYCW